ncbi:uncharacterized protein LOC111593957 [Drosophila hydei]|uniref:Uncharacterized protein LOC111593957 n=1 Tax=Drosophila hydei TaxID=7224 RepID=A0A6J1LEG7_DROHY|nr:uncharacterized protein LOC111593957 [Drosophila hydei]
MDINIHYAVYKVDINFQMKKWGNGYKTWLGNYTVDFCSFLRKPNHPVIKILYNIFRDFSTLNHTCPYVGTQLIRNLFWDPKDLVVPLPSGDYMLLLTWIFDKRKQFVTNIYFTFAQDIFKD